MNKTDKKLFKFSDGISDDTKFENNDEVEFKNDKDKYDNKEENVNDKSFENEQIEVLNQDGNVNNYNNKIINGSINKSKNEKNKSTKYDQDKKIERILKDKERI